MGRNSGGLRESVAKAHVLSERDYHAESVKLRKETLEMAESLKSAPLHFWINNGIEMDVEIQSLI